MMMTERSCAVVSVDGVTYLVLPEEDRRPSGPRRATAEDIRMPLDGAHLVRVLPGGVGEDFLWAMTRPGTPVLPSDASTAGAGVAAAVAARLYGLVAGSGDVVGTEVACGRQRAYSPPRGDWWSGSWLCDADDAGTSAARLKVERCVQLLMHGDLVVR